VTGAVARGVGRSPRASRPPRDRAAAVKASALAGTAPVASRLERLFVVLALTVQAGAFVSVPRLLMGIENPREINGKLVDLGESNPLNFALLGVTAVIVVALLWRHRVPALRMLGRNWIALTVTVLVIASTLWSVDPDLTLRRSGAYTISFLLAIYIATRFGFTDIIKLLGYMTALAAAGSILFTLAMPSMALMHDPDLEGNLRGVFTHKNGLARVMMVGILAHAYLAIFTRARAWPCFWAVVELALLVLARSVNSAVGAMIVMGSLSIYLVWRLHRPIAATITAVVGVGLLAVLMTAGSDLNAALELVGKDITLTGRTELWHVMLEYIGQRPLLGWGYSAFFQIDNPDAVTLWTRLRWNPPNTHNGLLEVLLDLGAAGLLLIAAQIVQTGFVIAQAARAKAWPEAWCFATFFVVCAALNLAEPTIIRSQEITSILFNTMLFSCSLLRAAPATARRRSAGVVSILERARPRHLDASGSGAMRPARIVE
jgi:exopolysaccharide production protein ExoQ